MCGRLDVDRMLGEMTSRQFNEWRHYDALEPFDETRTDVRFASIVHALWNINRDPKKTPTPYKLQDFVLQFGESGAVASQSDPETQMRLLTAIAYAMGGKDSPDPPPSTRRKTTKRGRT